MHPHPELRDRDTPRAWHRPWQDPPGFFVPGCFCCGGGTSTYYTVGGVAAGSARRDNDQFAATAWTSKTDIVAPGRHSTGAASHAGKAHVYGGSTGSVIQDNDQYVPSGDSWTSKTDLPTPARQSLCGVAISGRLYAQGGANATASTVYADNDEYDIGLDAWTARANLPNARHLLRCFAIGSKGHAVGAAGVKWNDEYNPSSDTWTTRSDLPDDRYAGFSFSIDGKGYYSAGTKQGVGLKQDTYEYDGAGDVWNARASIPAPARADGGGASVASASAGWATAGNAEIRDHDEYVVNAWTSRTDCPTPGRFWNVSFEV
jgi:N-acetylneuraminic acid mutarotase